MIAVGTRLADFTTGSQSCFNNLEVRFIGINVAGHDAFKNGALPIQADAREALRALRQRANTTGVEFPKAYTTEVEEAKRAWSRTLEREAFTPVKGEAMVVSRVFSKKENHGRDSE